MTHDASNDRTNEDPVQEAAGEKAARARSWRDNEVDTSRYSRKTRHLPHLEDESGYERDSVPLPKPVEEQTFFERLKQKFRD